MSNPFSILKKCDYFILSSLYEGLPMSIMEALILDKPVICTNIDGPRTVSYTHLTRAKNPVETYQEVYRQFQGE